jgi:Protein of unknown function (DUF3617)
MQDKAADRKGNTFSWTVVCTMAKGGVVHSEGTARYDGDQMEADVKTSTTRPQSLPIETSVHVTGRYVGPCD